MNTRLKINQGLQRFLSDVRKTVSTNVRDGSAVYSFLVPQFSSAFDFLEHAVFIGQIYMRIYTNKGIHASNPNLHKLNKPS